MAEGVVSRAEGKSGGSIFHIGDGYHYLLKESRSSRLRLKCRHYTAGCRGTASLNLHTGILHHLKRHYHDPDPLILQDLALRRLILEDARREYLGRKPRSILIDWKLRCRNPELAMRFTNSRMHSALYTAYASYHPKIPNTLLHLGILLGLPDMAAVCRTVDGQDLIFRGLAGVAAEKTLSVVFVSGRMLQFLQGLLSLHADGTFRKRCRKPKCSQIYNIVTKYGNSVVAIARVLMTRKTEAAYVALLRYLKVLAPNMEPSVIHCDFERSQMNAWRIVFPATEISGCLWHYAVACSKYARKHGMADLARDNDMVYSFLRCFCAAPMLPRHLIIEGVLEVWTEIQASGWGPEFESLFHYMQREWFPRVDELSVYDQADRTNNCSESDNRMIANVLPQNHPNVWNLIGGFVQLEYLAWCTKLAVDDGRAVNGPRRWSAILNDSRVSNYSTLLEQGVLSPGQFLHRVSWSIVAAVDRGLDLNDSDDESDSDDDY